VGVPLEAGVLDILSGGGGASQKNFEETTRE
jgi:hypothetical protein